MQYWTDFGRERHYEDCGSLRMSFSSLAVNCRPRLIPLVWDGGQHHECIRSRPVGRSKPCLPSRAWHRTLIVAVVSIAFLGETLSPASQWAILLIGLGITSLSVTRGVEGLRNLRMMVFALGTGGFIAAYAVLDGLWARASGTAHDYMVWVSLVSSAFIVGVAHFLGSKSGGAPIGGRTRIAGSGIRSHKLCLVVDDNLGNDVGADTPGVCFARDQHCVRCRYRCRILKERLNLARLVSITGNTDRHYYIKIQPLAAAQPDCLIGTQTELPRGRCSAFTSSSPPISRSRSTRA